MVMGMVMVMVKERERECYKQNEYRTLKKATSDGDGDGDGDDGEFFEGFSSHALFAANSLQQPALLRIAAQLTVPSAFLRTELLQDRRANIAQVLDIHQMDAA